MKFNAEEFYPTPTALLEKITAGFDWRQAASILEPSAGAGNIAEFCRDRLNHHPGWSHNIDIDCIEIDPDLQKVLREKDFRVIHNDFLTFSSFKDYDLIFMNPPFSVGAAHLMKALDLQRHGGFILCILNAGTLRHPCTAERKLLVSRLRELNASIEYVRHAFSDTEHPTDVEVAVIKVAIPKPEEHSFIYETLVKTKYAEPSVDNSLHTPAPRDFIDAAVRQYNIEAEAGIRLIREYLALSPHILRNLKDSAYNSPILELRLGNGSLSVNSYLRDVRAKYWTALFNNKKFTGAMTQNLASRYRAQVDRLRDYDFSAHNIREIEIQMRRELTRGIEECIVELFDELSHQYSYSDETKRNIHYFNGWKTNKSWIINKKVILPWMNAFSTYSGSFEPDYRVSEKLSDIERALNYLDGGRTVNIDVYGTLQAAKESGITRKIRLKYFYVTFYKKGTCHIEFTDGELLKKLNIFGSQQKGWLPPAYGKKKYWQMERGERDVVNSFEGRESYEKTLANRKFFIYDPKSSVPMIGMDEAA